MDVVWPVPTLPVIPVGKQVIQNERLIQCFGVLHTIKYFSNELDVLFEYLKIAAVPNYSFKYF